MPRPNLWIIAGPNGAGKTTLVRKGAFAKIVPSDSLINPDDITLELLKSEGINTWADAPMEAQKRLFIKAANEAQRRLEEKVEFGEVAVIESVLSTTKYQALVERTLALGGYFFLVYVALRSSTLSHARVTKRFSEGGHDVPADKLEHRWRESLAIAPWFAARATKFWLVDNSSAETGLAPPLLLSGAGATVQVHAPSEDPAIETICRDFLANTIKENPRRGWRLQA